ncbi:MAG: hypothetical protein AB1Z19_09170 [Eubacteriales bacterium]
MTKQRQRTAPKKTVNTTESLNDKAIDAIAENTGKALKEENKVQVIIPKVDGESDTVECCINGYNYVIKKGVSVALPKSVVSVLKNAGLV